MFTHFMFCLFLCVQRMLLDVLASGGFSAVASEVVRRCVLQVRGPQIISIK
jgi:hypothetical protein